MVAKDHDIATCNLKFWTNVKLTRILTFYSTEANFTESVAFENQHIFFSYYRIGTNFCVRFM